MAFKATKLFFDRKVVIDAVGRAGARALAKSGALIRKVAQRSMPYRKKSSEPGAPPSAHKPHAYLRKFLFFSFDPASKSVVVGPEKLPRKTKVPSILEFGGDSRFENPRRKIRRLNGGGELRFGGTGKTAKLVTDSLLGKRIVITYGKLKTAAQVRKANEINEKLYGPDIITAHYEPRPYMAPALTKSIAQLPSLWANSVSR